MFCNVTPEAVIEEKDVAHTIYEVPAHAPAGKARRTGGANISSSTFLRRTWTAWRGLCRPDHHAEAPGENRCRRQVHGKPRRLQRAIYESLTHAGAAADAGVTLSHHRCGGNRGTRRGEIPERPGRHPWCRAASVSAASREKSWPHAMLAPKRFPYLGLCLGLQIAVVDFARDVLGLTKAHSTEFNSESPDPVISMLDDQKQVVKMGGHDAPRGFGLSSHSRHKNPAGLRHGPAQQKRHRHRYEFNNTLPRKNGERTALSSRERHSRPESWSS